MDENAIRDGWKTGSHCQIYSNSKKKWFQGEVTQIFTDEEGEWLEVRYRYDNKSTSKQVTRYSSDIRPIQDDIYSSNDNKKVQYDESTNIKEFDFEEFCKKWNELLKQQKYKEAEKLCHQFLEKSSTFSGYLHSCLADLYLKNLNYKTFDFNHILGYYVLSLRLCPSNTDSHYNLANFLLKQAMQHLLRAKELNPNHKKTCRLLKNIDFDDDNDNEYLPHRVDPCYYEIKSGKIHIYEYDDN
eukprot:526505_1